MKKTIATVKFLTVWICAISQPVDSVQLFIDTIESQLEYQQGEVVLANGVGKFTIPETFRFLNAAQARYVLEDLWGNPTDSTVLGMIVPANRGVLSDNAWAFIVTYEELGYVKDDDADQINYEELLEEMKNDLVNENEQRVQDGFEAISLIGWATRPYYDADKKVLHWAKELRFGENEVNTLNYNVRILGRKGVMVLNAVASMNELAEVNEGIQPVLSSFSYSDGYKYDDFNPDLDEVAAWTIGGLVAGKVLAKAGILAILLKYIKVLGLGIVALGGAIWKWYRKKTEPPVVRELADTEQKS